MKGNTTMSETGAALKYLLRVARIWLTEELIGLAMKACPEGYVMSTVESAALQYGRGLAEGAKSLYSRRQLETDNARMRSDLSEIIGALRSAKLLAENSLQAVSPDRRRQWLHRKRQTTYTELGRGRLQIDCDHDMTEVVIYESNKDGTLWARPAAEFADGRFVPVVIFNGKGVVRHDP